MKHNTNNWTENLDFSVDNENNVEKSTILQASNQNGSGLTAYETNKYITEDKAINWNLKVYNLPDSDKIKFDPLQFLHSKYDKI